ncbi:MAG TPA: AAA family ATPase, partial [Acidimicrobiales bacterium]
MLVELAVRDLGVIPELRLVLGPGMTAVTGETGAGKTMVVDAIELLVGGRSDPALVRTGADEAWVEGRFVAGEREVVAARAVPRNGRSRAYVDGRLATAGELAELGAGLVDLHGQHAHQSLLHPAAQREALDRFGRVDLAPLTEARREVRALTAELAGLGGDERARARELDLVRYQVAEIQGAALTGPDEDEALEAQEDALADATAHREAAAGAVEALSGEGAASDALGTAVALLAGRGPFAADEQRLRALAAELTDASADLRLRAEEIEEDPDRLATVRERRQLLHDLRRKYGDTLADVIAYGDEARTRLEELESYEARAAQLERDLAGARAEVAAAETAVGAARRAA